MTKFTKEQLQQIEAAAKEVLWPVVWSEKKAREHFCEKITPKVVLKLARIALASLEAEPVCYLTWHQGFRAPDDCEEYVVEAKPGDKSCDGSPAFPVYTALPAPVTVPDLLEQFAEFMAAESIKSGDYPDSWQCKASNAAHEYAQNIRAAMLQCVEQQQNQQQNIPENIPFEQWLSQQTGTIDVECGCVMTEVFFHWLRVAYEAGNSPVIPDGYCIMPLKLTADNGAKGALCGEFHVQYRIVCQSCVGEGCEDCNHIGGWDAEIPVSWDTIKRIHEAAVEACALPAAPQQEVK
ncbi:hypothetical protein ACKU0O_021040 [Enterobacter hormaechei]|uniref:hypothetical protein n=1 Tax=Enterobacter hormaechei TaxID=158836 RepID=UPI0007988A8E|nr:hypothetical protein [Enterobacter hormaechei]EJV4645637.1 hypothetical protein [Enterobacter hormaechei]ELH4046086.1 hypothetical protein [Enterobacter hormaechei]SAF21171.1 Uncharacterised protein [Enterobacter hormaechei]